MNLTKKQFLEATLGKARQINDQYAVDGVLPAEHQAKFDTLLDTFHAATGQHVPRGAEDFKRFTNGSAGLTPDALTAADLSNLSCVGNPQAFAAARRELGAAPSGSQFSFKDASTGQMVSSLAPGERFVDRLEGPRQLDDDGPSVGEVIRAIATGTASDMGQLSAITGDDSKGGHMTSRELSNRIIDLARNASVVAKAGAQTLPMKEGQLDLLRVDADPVAHWRPEATTIEQSNPAYGLVSLRAKTVGAIVPVSIEFLEDGRNAAQMLETQMQAALGQALDLAALNGKGAESEPLGIANHEGINSVASVGTPDGYGKITQAVGKILQANYPGEVDNLSLIMSPRDGETFDGLTDTTGQPLQPTSWAAAPKRFYTNSVPTNLGGGEDESFALLGDYTQVLLGMKTEGVRIAILNSGTVTVGGSTVDAASSLQRLVVAFLRADVAVLRPTWFTKLSGITA